jgi:hypothetical protein
MGSDVPDGGIAGLRKEFGRLTQLHRNDPQNFPVYKRGDKPGRKSQTSSGAAKSRPLKRTMINHA